MPNELAFYSLCKLALTFFSPMILSVYLSNITGKKRRRKISKNKMPSLASVSFLKMFFLGEESFHLIMYSSSTLIIFVDTFTIFDKH
jgi:hypothetical protein